MRYLFYLLLLLPLANAQSLWLESGLSYTENLTDKEANQNFEPFLKTGLRATLPLSDTLSLYVAPYWQGSFAADAGLWIDFPGRIQDLEGVNTFMSVGLSYSSLLDTDSATGLTVSRDAYGVALGGGVSYDLLSNFALTLSYTHRPIFAPSLAQSFDVSLGFRLALTP